MGLEEIWRQRTDEELVQASRSLAEYTDDAERVIRAELARRGLPEPPRFQREREARSALPRLSSSGLSGFLFALAALVTLAAFYGIQGTLFVIAPFGALVLAAAFVALWAAGVAMRGRHRAEVQRRRDREARALADELLAAREAGPFISI